MTEATQLLVTESEWRKRLELAYRHGLVRGMSTAGIESDDDIERAVDDARYGMDYGRIMAGQEPELSYGFYSYHRPTPFSRAAWFWSGWFTAIAVAMAVAFVV